MLIRFWGTRGSIAKAGATTARYGGNTSCVELRSRRGTLVMLDSGTGAHGFGQALLAGPRPVRGHILIGHTHWDHIQGFPFFAPLFVPGNEWHVYGPRGVGTSLRDSLSGQMQYTYFPITLDALGAAVHFHDLLEGTLQVGDIHVVAQYLNHPALTLGYRLEADGAAIVYSTDHEPHSRRLAAGERAPLAGEEERHVRFLAEADLVVHDAQYTAAEYPAKTGWGHSTIEYVVDTALAAGVRRLALFHHDPLRDDDAIDRLVDAARQRVARAGGATEVFAAAEGQTLELEGARPAVAAPESETARLAPALTTTAQKVLLVAQDPAIADALAEAVRADALRVTRIQPGAEARAVLRSERPALVLVQSGGSHGDTIALCRELRAEVEAAGEGTPIVLVRADEGPDRQHAEAAAGVTDWLPWPCSQEYARTRIRAWVLRETCRWRRAPLPADEEKRLHTLQQSGLLDSEAEERFDRLTRIAAALFDVPIALVTLVDGSRQWFKSAQGIEIRETHRDYAFCAHAILGPDILHVPDALHDDRFADNPVVTGANRVRFYAGAPLSFDDGSQAGTLCVVDHRARRLSPEQLRLLDDLARLVEHELRAHPAAPAR